MCRRSADYVTKAPCIAGMQGAWVRRFLLPCCRAAGRPPADGHIGVCVDTLDQRLELDGLEAVDHNVQHRLGRVRVEAVGVYDGQARAEFLRHGAGVSSGWVVMIMAALALSRPSTMKSTVLEPAA